LTRDRIVTAAITLLDASGADGLTMRKLAEHLGVGSTTLYWHVKTKDDVLDLAVDAIFDEVTLPQPHDDWKDDIRELVVQWLDTMLRHPWAAPLLGRPMLGPNVLARTEFLQATLVRAGLTGTELSAATHGIANYVIGSALTQSTWQRITDPEVKAFAHTHIRENAEQYPTLAATDHLHGQDWDALFRRGLEFMLAGLTT
jgi:AcrR family transcriptional regulator